MDKVDKAIERLKLGSDMSLRYYGKPLMITYSGGKDSEVLVDLAIKSKIPLEIVNSHTTADAAQLYIIYATNSKNGRRKALTAR